MDVLDADDRRLGIEGRYAERDIVQVCVIQYKKNSRTELSMK